ncbi:MAG: bifunctional precorrin-2 dehydrogenase/sirohydrochlorin ferrochelatase [Eggerthella lenta]
MVETVRERIPDGAEEGASYYPVFLDVRGRTALVVGGGAVAERKAAGLARAGACVRVVAPTVTAGLEAQARDGLVDLRRRAFRENDVEGVFLVYAATDDAAVNEAVYAEAEARGVPANVVDDPALQLHRAVGGAARDCIGRVTSNRACLANGAAELGAPGLGGLLHRWRGARPRVRKPAAKPSAPPVLRAAATWGAPRRAQASGSMPRPYAEALTLAGVTA